MTCSGWTAELVERARGCGEDAEPGGELRAHLAVCAQCRERWDAQRQLTSQIETIRMRTAAMRSPDELRVSLLRDFGMRDFRMREFERMHRRRAVPSWAWALSAAAAVLLAVFLGHMWGQAAGKKRTREVRREQTVLYEASDILSNDASALSNDDFIAVPYTPPLAPGEMVKVVHADLYPEALASMGVEIDPSWGERLPADVVVGEDGLPRAVRIADNGAN